MYIAGNNSRGVQQTVISQQTDNFSFSDFVERFIEEALQLAKFEHKNIVVVKDVFKLNNTAYLVMEYIEAITLKDKI